MVARTQCFKRKNPEKNSYCFSSEWSRCCTLAVWNSIPTFDSFSAVYLLMTYYICQNMQYTTEHTAWKTVFPDSNVLDFRPDTGEWHTTQPKPGIRENKLIIAKHNNTLQIYLLKNMCPYII